MKRPSVHGRRRLTTAGPTAIMRADTETDAPSVVSVVLELTPRQYVPLTSGKGRSWGDFFDH